MERIKNGTGITHEIEDRFGSISDATQKIAQLVSEIRTGADKQNPLVAMEPSRMSLKWLKDHIRVHDKEFAAYCNSHKKAGK